MELGDGLKKLLLAGVGTVAVTAEKSKEILDELVKKGELTVEQGKVLNQELKHNIKETIKTKTTPAPKAPKEDIKDTLANFHRSSLQNSKSRSSRWKHQRQRKNQKPRKLQRKKLLQQLKSRHRNERRNKQQKRSSNEQTRQ